MSHRRRRANDFIDSLNSYRSTTDSERDFDSDTLRSFSEDSLATSSIRDSVRSENSSCSSKHSTILAGSSFNDSLMKNTSVPSNASRSLVHSIPDLNKRIDLFRNENSEEQVKHKSMAARQCAVANDKENNDPQYLRENVLAHNQNTSKVPSNKLPSISKKKNVPFLSQKSKNSIANKDPGRDTNYNIQSSTPETNYLHKQNASQQMEFSKANPINQEDCNEINLESTEGGKDVKKFETILCSLDNQLNQIKETTKPQQQILRRLSEKFVDSPKNFTEKLLTIIEESVVNNEYDACNTSAIDLSRLTTEFRKMCKFIEDESMPEWPSLSFSSPPYMEHTPRSPACVKSTGIITRKHEKSLISFTTNAKSLTNTPVSGLDRMKTGKRLFRQISKNNITGSINNITNLSLSENSIATFEHLEAQCMKLESDEHKSVQPIRKSLSVPSLLSMSDIQIICEKQMADLDASCAIIEDHPGKTGTPNSVHQYLYKNSPIKSSKKVEQRPYYSPLKLQESHYKSKVLQQQNISYSKRKSRKINLRSEYNTPETDGVTNNYIKVDPDELEKTLLQDIAEKRQRCLDTAKLLAEINADPEVMEVQEALKKSPLFIENAESNSQQNSDAKFLNTLMSCKDYHTYLRKQRPLFNLLQNSSLSVPEIICNEHDPKPEEKRDTEKAIFSSDKSPQVKNRNSNTDHKSRCVSRSPRKPKLFVTPGKSPVNKRCIKKPVYFPNLENDLKSKKGDNILKSPHAEGLYRLNYNTIISPVGMYIKGTDMQLIKNVRAKTDGHLLTPVKRQNKPSPAKSSGQSTLSKGIGKSQEKASLKVKLSAKSCLSPKTCTPETPKSTPDHYFVLPKVSYKLPLQVRTIKEKGPTKTGSRVKGLLEAAQSKIVIRHEGRVNSIKKKQYTGGAQDKEEVQINYNPQDESIHIEQAAFKTNFIHRQKKV